VAVAIHFAGLVAVGRATNIGLKTLHRSRRVHDQAATSPAK
jgi:hypothetical protein